MRPPIRRLLAYSSQKPLNRCLQCQFAHFPLRQSVTTRSIRFYSDEKSRDSNDSGVESTGTVPSDPDLITTETPQIQSPPPSSLPDPPANPPTKNAKEPWTFKQWKGGRDSKSKAKDMRRAIEHTSLRRRVHWFPPLLGVNPAYDMALEYLEMIRREKIDVIQRLERKIQAERDSTLPNFPASKPVRLTSRSLCELIG